MPKRTVAGLFHTYKVGSGYAVAAKGDEITVTEDEAKRGDALGAFETAAGRRASAKSEAEADG